MLLLLLACFCSPFLSKRAAMRKSRYRRRTSCGPLPQRDTCNSSAPVQQRQTPSLVCCKLNQAEQSSAQADSYMLPSAFTNMPMETERSVNLEGISAGKVCKPRTPHQNTTAHHLEGSFSWTTGEPGRPMGCTTRVDKPRPGPSVDPAASQNFT